MIIDKNIIKMKNKMKNLFYGFLSSVVRLFGMKGSWKWAVKK